MRTIAAIDVGLHAMRIIVENWKLRLQEEGRLLLEKWALLKRCPLFQEVFGTQLEIQG